MAKPLARWKQLPTDEGARYANELRLDADSLEPMVTFGTNPGMGVPITGAVPDPDGLTDRAERESAHRALRYMGLTPGRPLAGNGHWLAQRTPTPALR